MVVTLLLIVYSNPKKGWNDALQYILIALDLTP